MSKCQFPNGLVIKPDGVHELDPCIYEVVERWGNVTVEVLRCEMCGSVQIEWHRQEDTVDLREAEP